jgi:hypothetical protein
MAAKTPLPSTPIEFWFNRRSSRDADKRAKAGVCLVPCALCLGHSVSPSRHRYLFRSGGRNAIHHTHSIRSSNFSSPQLNSFSIPRFQLCTSTLHGLTRHRQPPGPKVCCWSTNSKFSFGKGPGPVFCRLGDTHTQIHGSWFPRKSWVMALGSVIGWYYRHHQARATRMAQMNTLLLY